MLFLNEHHSVANLLKIVRAQQGGFPEPNDLKRAVSRCLSDAQGTRLSTDDEIVVSFEDNPLGMQAAQQALFAGEGNQLAARLTADERVSAERNIQHALLLIRHVDPSLHTLMRLVVTDVVCVRVQGSGGGTASNLLGVIWLSPHPRWTTIDYAECLIHEFVHLNIFLGDMVHRIYVNARTVREPDAQVMSAVRQERRPIDKALHSACVAATLSYFYRLLGDNVTADSFLPPLNLCVKEIHGPAYRYLAPYGQRLVAELDSFLQQPTVAWVSTRITDRELLDPMPARATAALR